ncbi:hypothetical protein NW768_011830 [Fusarium equiseti]|uniref:WSC domain-containing protein n=1 Tax=Fusarium equiseti TaxID=61235 RepID=A0ABQ8QWM7_FUSEQ|nr:hypothetical protein NW768_011830 [Fusarium equiseti]
MHQLPPRSFKASAYAAWGCYAWLSAHGSYYKGKPVDFTPILPIPGSSNSTCPYDWPVYLEPEYSDHSFMEWCRLWTIAQEIQVVYGRDVETPLQDVVPFAFVESKYQKLLTWADNLNQGIKRQDQKFPHVSVIQFYNFMINGAVLHIMDVALHNRDTLGWRLNVALGKAWIREIYVRYAVAGKLAQACMAIGLDTGNTSSEEAREFMEDLELRGRHHNLADVAASCIVDFGVAMSSHNDVCKANDPNSQAFQKNKANGSAFCSTYIRSTITSTVTPVGTKTAFVTKSLKTTTTAVNTVRTTVSTVTIVTKIGGTVSTVVTKTDTAFITDYQTATSTYLSTTTPSDTYTIHRMGTITQQVTQTTTKAAETTVTKVVDTATTTFVPASIVYTGGSTTVLTTRYTATTVSASVVYIPDAVVHCAVVGNTHDIAVNGRGGSLSFGECKEFCNGWRYFGLTSIGCWCFVSHIEENVVVDKSSPTTFWDLACDSANPPNNRHKRAVQTVSVPSYLPNKTPSAVSSACSCLITKPGAALTTKVTAKSSKTVTTTKTQEVVSTVTSQLTTVSTTTLTGTYTREITTTITNSQWVRKTNRLAATTTEVKTHIITNFDHLVYVYKTQFVTATNFNFVTTTSTRTIPNIRYNTVVVTRTQPTTLTRDVYTSSQTVVSTRTVLTGASTITGGTTTLYGTISRF